MTLHGFKYFKQIDPLGLCRHQKPSVMQRLVFINVSYCLRTVLVMIFARVWRLFSNPPHCMYHQFSDEKCFCFPSTVSHSDSMSTMRLRYMHRNTYNTVVTHTLEEEMSRYKSNSMKSTPLNRDHMQWDPLKPKHPCLQRVLTPVDRRRRCNARRERDENPGEMRCICKTPQTPRRRPDNG